MKDIGQKKREALDKAGGNRYKTDFDLQRDVYDKICPGGVKNFNYDLDVHTYSVKGERAPVEEKTPEQLADHAFRNYVYELSFQEVEKIQRDVHKKRILEAKQRAQQAKLNPKPKAPKPIKKNEDDEYDEEQNDEEDDMSKTGSEELSDEDEEEEEEDELTTIKFDFRDEWIEQQKYVKHMEQANFLWDQFTSGNTLQRLKK